MNVFNRIVVALLCVLLVAAAVSLIALAWTSPGESIDGLRDAVDWLEEHNEDLEKAFLTAGAVLAGLLALIVFGLELVPSHGTEVKVTDLRVGNAVLSTAAVSQRVEEAVNQVPHVSDARVVVKGKRKGVKVSMDLHVDPDANLAAVTDAACETVQDVLSNRVHVALAEPPRARVFYREIRFKRPPLRQPGAAPANGAEPYRPETETAGEERPAAEAAEAEMAAEDLALAPAGEEPARTAEAGVPLAAEERPAEERRPEGQ